MKIQNLKTVSYRTPLPPIGSLSKDDGDGKEKKKSSRFRAFLHGVGGPRRAGGGGGGVFFLYISLPSLHDYDVKMPNFAFHRGKTQAMTKFLLYL